MCLKKVILFEIKIKNLNSWSILLRYPAICIKLSFYLYYNKRDFI